MTMVDDTHVQEHSSEAMLLSIVNKGLALAVRNRYDELADKQRAMALSNEEHQEMIVLAGKIEQATVKRTKALIELAQLRGISLSALLDDPDISKPVDELEQSPIHV